MPIRHSTDEAARQARIIARKNGISAENPVIYKKSLDARHKGDIHFVYSFLLDAEKLPNGKLSENLRLYDDKSAFDLKGLSESVSEKNRHKKILVVGSGPCGLFAAYVLSVCGADVTVIERGDRVDERMKKIESFWKGGELDPNTNVQFGEGGAGTFSDGKLNTGINSPLQRFVLEVFAECGAPKDILYLAKPHIGTDFLRRCVTNMREKIIDNGGKFCFNTCLTDLQIKDGRVVGAELSGMGFADFDRIILAPGHSARDTYEMLERRGVAMERKPFAVGVRIEHSREYINRGQYGTAKDTELLPTADYRLAYNGNVRSCYSFCMCPGGVVVNASSESGGLVVNGMSFHDRMEKNSNSALVVTVRPEDFDGESPLSGVEFQRRYERLAFAACGGAAPVQLARDFVSDRASRCLGNVEPSFTGKTEPADLRTCLPQFASETLKEGLIYFDRRMKGYSTGDAVMTGVEMRTSAPLRIKRGESGESVSAKGLYPAGEGAGYAGGIMSAAIDGIKTAEKILKN